MAGLRDGNHFRHLFICSPHIDPAAQFPIDAVVTQFMSAITLDNPLSVVLGDNVEVIGNAQKNLIVPGDLLLQDLNILFEPVRILG